MLLIYSLPPGAALIVFCKDIAGFLGVRSLADAVVSPLQTHYWFLPPPPHLLFCYHEREAHEEGATDWQDDL